MRCQMQSISSNITISINDHKILIRIKNYFGGKIAKKLRGRSAANRKKIGTTSGKIGQQIGTL